MFTVYIKTCANWFDSEKLIFYLNHITACATMHVLVKVFLKIMRYLQREAEIYVTRICDDF